MTYVTVVRKGERSGQVSFYNAGSVKSHIIGFNKESHRTFGFYALTFLNVADNVSYLVSCKAFYFALLARETRQRKDTKITISCALQHNETKRYTLLCSPRSLLIVAIHNVNLSSPEQSLRNVLEQVKQIRKL